MRFLIKGIFLFVLVIGLLLGFFSLYSHFLMEYSLDSLKIVASATKDDSYFDEKLSNASQNAYLGVVQGMAIEEASKNELDMQSLALLELAARSLGDAQYRTGYMRANRYLKAVMENKKPERPFMVRYMDSLAKGFLDGMKAISDFVSYSLQRKDQKEEVLEKVDLENFASSILLNQAQEKEQNGLFTQAEEKYKQIIHTYKNNENRPMVAVSLANILIRERKFDEASQFLRNAQHEFSGSQEGELIEKLIQRVNSIKDKLKLIVKLKRQVLKEKSPLERQKVFLKLGTTYVATYQFEKAVSVFLKLKNSESGSIRQKASFYLGWIYKNNAEYGKSVQIFVKLLEDPDIKEDAEFALRAQLADVYYKKGDVKQSAEMYKAISAMHSAVSGSGKKLSKGAAWASFSESELVNIYSFDLKDPREVRLHMDRLMNLLGSSNSVQSLALTLSWAGKISLRDLGFNALVDRRLTKALDLFTKYLEQNSDDSLTLTGLATVYALMGDLERARTFAQKGYDRQPSEYSILMVGYVEGLLGNYKKSIESYQEALALNPNSDAAKFNMAYGFLKSKQYQLALDIMMPFKKALDGMPSQRFLLAKTLNNIGYCYWGLGDSTKDVLYFKKALEVNPEFTTAQRNLTEIQRHAAPQASRMVE